MHVRHEQFESGWLGVSIALTDQEVSQLIDRLRELQRGELGHFHVRNDRWEGDLRVADIESSMKGVEEADNMQLE